MAQIIIAAKVVLNLLILCDLIEPNALKYLNRRNTKYKNTKRSIFNWCSFFNTSRILEIYGSQRQLFSRIDV